MATEKRSKYYKHPKYGHVYGEDMVTPGARLIWPHLVKPKDPPPPTEGQQQGAPRYELSFMIPKTEATEAWLNALKKMVSEMLVIFNDDKKAKLSIEKFLQDGDSDFDLERYPQLAQHYVLQGRNTQAIKLVDAKLKPVGPEVVQGGMIGKGSLTPLITAHGLSFKLQAVQVLRDDGQRFLGGTRDATALFDECEGDTFESAVSEPEGEPETVSEALDEAIGTEPTPPTAPVDLEAPAPVAVQSAALVGKAAAAKAETVTNTKKGGAGKAAAVNLL